MDRRRYLIVMTLLGGALLLLAAACLLLGSVKIPARSVIDILMGHGSENRAWEIIVLQSRLPMIATAALAGAALSVSGLLLQTTFNNPLAGAGVVLAVLIGMSAIVKSSTMLLIVGILVSYLASSVISLLNSQATEEGIHNYVAWGFGTFSGVSVEQMPVYAAIIVLALMGAALMVKPLNALLLGTRYAENLGVNTHRTRNLLLLITGVLTAVVTAFCGPIGFVGLVVPHIARLTLNTSNHTRLLPATMLCGAVTALLCSLLSVVGQHGIIPINAITPIIGVPIILYIIVNRRKIQYFN